MVSGTRCPACCDYVRKRSESRAAAPKGRCPVEHRGELVFVETSLETCLNIEGHYSACNRLSVYYVILVNDDIPLHASNADHLTSFCKQTVAKLRWKQQTTRPKLNQHEPNAHLRKNHE